MSMEKTGAFLADCLAHMPEQRGKAKAVVDTVIAGLTRIANGGEWPRDAALAAREAIFWQWSRPAADAADWAAAAYAAANAADWVAVKAADWVAVKAEARAAADAASWASWAAADAAEWAARAHHDPDAERARQAKVREELGL